MTLDLIALAPPTSHEFSPESRELYLHIRNVARYHDRMIDFVRRHDGPTLGGDVLCCVFEGVQSFCTNYGRTKFTSVHILECALMLCTSYISEDARAKERYMSQEHGYTTSDSVTKSHANRTTARG